MRVKLRPFGKALIEASWLAAAAVLPLFFNISSVQVFEPDKMFVLKFLVIVAGASWILTRGEALQPAIGSRLKTFFKIPLIRPVFGLATIYVVSSVCSIVPRVSWLGSYRRAQGTIAFFCYAVIFLLIIDELRRPAQLKRIQFILVLTSVPAAAYAILQRFSIDTLPWQGLVGRSSGTMGNPIFLGGYLVMVIPLTFFRIMEGIRRLRENSACMSDVALVCSCAFAFLLQLGALISAQSRGPLAALAAALYLCIFIVLVGTRSAGAGGIVPPMGAAGIGLLVPLVLLAIVRFASSLPAMFFLAVIAGTIALIGLGYFFIWRTSFGRSWFWLSWLSQFVSLLLLFALLSSGIIGSSGISQFGRLANSSDPVRKALWTTSIEYGRRGAPAILPDGTRDSLHFLRMVFGYGPECAWLPGNLYAVPALVKLHPESPMDRMHNETFDNFLMLGFAGVIASLALLAVGMFYALRLLGFQCAGRWKTIFYLLAGLGGFAGIAVAFCAKVSYLAGIGAVLGLFVGVLVFVAANGFCRASPCFDGSSRQWLVLGLACGLVAHVIESGFAIAVTPTRFYFYMFLGLLAVLSVRDVEPPWEEAPKGPRKPDRSVQNRLIPCMALSGLVLMVPSWYFIFNTAPGLGSFQIFKHSWFLHGPGQGLPISAGLMIILVTIAGSLGLMASEITEPLLRGSGIRKKMFLFVISGAALWLVVGISTANFWTVQDRSSALLVSQHTEARMNIFWVWLILFLGFTAVLLRPFGKGEVSERAVRIRGWVPGFVVLLCAAGGIWTLALRPAMADVAARAASAYESIGDEASAALLYRRASALAPGESTYMLSWGLAQASAGADSGEELTAAEQVLKSALQMNRLDPFAYRTLGAFHEQAAERSNDPASRERELENAITYFQKQSMFSPNFPDAYAQMGRCYFLMGKYEKAEGLLEKSLGMAPRYFRTYMFLGEMFYRRNELQKALQSYSNAAIWNGGNVEARKNMGVLLALLNRPDEAIRMNLETVRSAPRDVILLKRISMLYFGRGDYSSGVIYAQKAFDATPPHERNTLDQLIQELKEQAGS